MTGQGEMQRQRATWMMKRVSGHGPGSRAARWKTGGSYSSNPTARRCARRLTHRLHAHELPTRAERRVLGLGGVSGAAAHPAQPWASTAAPGPGPPPAHPSPGGPHSVGSKSSFFQAKIGPVDGQSLSGLSSGIQTESVKTKSQTVTDSNSPHPSWCWQSLTTSLGGGGLSVPDPASRSPPYLATLQSGPREDGDPLLQDTGQCPQCPLVSCVLF